jgi:hypothetical protein
LPEKTMCTFPAPSTLIERALFGVTKAAVNSALTRSSSDQIRSFAAATDSGVCVSQRMHAKTRTREAERQA